MPVYNVTGTSSGEQLLLSVPLDNQADASITTSVALSAVPGASTLANVLASEQFFNAVRAVRVPSADRVLTPPACHTVVTSDLYAMLSSSLRDLQYASADEGCLLSPNDSIVLWASITFTLRSLKGAAKRCRLFKIVVALTP